MRATLRVERRASLAAASALLVEGLETARLLDLLARVGEGATVHGTAAGFLLRLAAPSEAPFPGCHRLRAVRPNLLVPVDGELVPALLDDEADGLAGTRGLVFLACGRVLSFSPREPVPPRDLLALEARREAWQALPEPPRLPDRIVEIRLERPDESPDAILRASGGAVGSESPRPPETPSSVDRAVGRAQLSTGNGLASLGRALGWQWLRDLGARLVGGALERAPGLTPEVLGGQEAALRELLREFREGDLEKALRRALPLGSEGDPGGRPATGARLPEREPRYSLAGLLGSRGGGAGSIWLGGQDVQVELAREYRKAAEQAAARGDFRRAAYIWGSLLRDYRSAANALARGGLHHDAAVLYLEKVGDPIAAARELEAAGEIDRALEIYRRRGNRIAAGDLLSRAGDDEGALAEYLLAADALEAEGGHAAAGELLLEKAGRPDLALLRFEAGWAARARRRRHEAVRCATRVARLASQARDEARLRGLVAEAEGWFATHGELELALPFFEVVARLSRDHEPALADHLRDRALLAIAAKLRRGATTDPRARELVSSTLVRAGAWSPAVVSDAAFAVDAALKRSKPRLEGAGGSTRLEVCPGGVTGVAFSPTAHAVVVGCADGSVHCHQRFGGELTHTIAPAGEGGPVRSLAVDDQARWVVVLRGRDDQGFELESWFRTSAGWRRTERRGEACTGAPFLLDRLLSGHLFLWNGVEVVLLRHHLLIPSGSLAIPGADDRLAALAPPPPGRGSFQDTEVLVVEGGLVRLVEVPRGVLSRATISWTPAAPPSSLWRPDGRLELAGVTSGGTLYWSRVQLADSTAETHAATAEGGYSAACLVRSELVAGVGRHSVEWLRVSGDGLTRAGVTLVAAPDAVACAALPGAREFAIVCADGSLVLVPLWR